MGIGKLEKEMKALIEAELLRVNREIATLKKEPRPAEQEGFGDNTPLSEEMEAAQVGEERELKADVLGSLLERAAALDESLHRIRNGSYGICVSCGERIETSRLQAVLETAYCLRCMVERERSVPIQEPRPIQWKETEKLYEERERLERGFERRPVSPEREAAFGRPSEEGEGRSEPKS